MRTKYGQGLLSPKQRIKHAYEIMTSTQRGNELSEQEVEQLINWMRYQQGIEYIQPGMRSGLLGRHNIKYEDQQAIQYIRPCDRSIRPRPPIFIYEDQPGIEHIRGPERSMCYDR